MQTTPLDNVVLVVSITVWYPGVVNVNELRGVFVISFLTPPGSDGS